MSSISKPLFLWYARPMSCGCRCWIWAWFSTLMRQTFTLNALAWGASTHGSGYTIAGQTAYLDAVLRWGFDWLIKVGLVYAQHYNQPRALADRTGTSVR